MNAKVRWEVDLRGIYIKEGVRSGKIPVRYPTKTSAVGFASRRRTWGTRSRKDLMKAHLKCQSTKSVPWAVKKVSSRGEVGCKEHRATIVTLKSSFLPKEPEKRILRGCCRGIGPKSSLSMYTMGLRPKPRTGRRPRRVNIVKRAHVSKRRSQFWS